MTDWHDRGLVSVGWLAARLGESELRLFDATVHLRPSPSGPYRIESGRADHDAAHIPGAAFLDLPGDLSDPGSPLPFTAPPPGVLARAFGAAGIGPGARVVVYSATTPMWASRIWWMLRAVGFDDAAVLDGGMAAWRTRGLAVEAGERRYPPNTLTANPRPDLWADKAQVLAAIGDGAVCTINALSAAVHSGEASTNYGRKGHIAGSLNVPYAGLLRPDGTFLDDGGLRERFEAAGAFARDRVICYCGGGISATMAALALTRLGHLHVAFYDGSMSEWSNDPDAPMALGA